MRIAAIALCLACLAEPAAAQDPRPLGAWFRDYERLTFDDEIAWPGGAYVVSNYDHPDFYVPFRVADLGQYSAVFFGRGSGKPLAAEELTAVERWVAAGGSLILAGEEGQRMFGSSPPAWVGVERWAVGKAVACAVKQPDHPLAKGLRQLDKDPAWETTTAAVGKPGTVSVLGKDELSLLLVTEHGKGKVVYLGGKLVPHGRPAYREKQFVHDLSPLARQTWRNLLEFLGTPRRADVIRQGLSKLDSEGNASVRVWWRYRKATPLGARLYAPPHPRAAEELAELSLDMGQGERLRRDFFVTSARDQRLTLTATDLVGPDGVRIPASACRFFVQERPVEGYTKAAYWLVPVSGPVPLAANETYTFWTIVQTPISRPGTYGGTIEFRDPDGKVTHRLPLKVELWDVHYPNSDLLHFELEHIWFTMPGGYWIEKDRSRRAELTLDGKPIVRTALNDPQLLSKYIRALGDLEVDFAQNWSDVGRLYPLAFIRLREGGELLSAELDRNPARFRGDKLPALDFSDGYDEKWDVAIDTGMRCHAMNYSLATDGTLSLARRIAGDDKLAEDAPLARRVRTWYWSEYAKYVRERGLYGVCTKIHDEFGPDGVADFVKSARAIREAGIKTYTTTYNFDRDRKSIAAASPHMDLWQMAWPKQSPFELYRELEIPFPKDAEVWGTTASSYWGNGQGARSAGWLAARLRYQGIHIHGYMRWQWNDHEGCFPGPDGPFNSVTVTNHAQGIVEGRYLAQLLRMIDHAKRTGRGADVAAAVEREWQTGVIGTDRSCLLSIRHQPGISGIDATWWTDVCVSPVTYEAAKRKVFELSVKLKKAAGPVGRDVRFRDFALVKDGRAVCRIVADARLAEPLTASVPELKGRIEDKAEGETPFILAGTLESAAVRGYVERSLAGEITARYPRPGRYAVREVPATKSSPAVLLIVGGDRAGVERGVRSVARLLTVENEW